MYFSEFPGCINPNCVNYNNFCLIFNKAQGLLHESMVALFIGHKKKLLERAAEVLSLELFCLEMTKQLSNLSNNIHQVLKEGKERYASQPHPLS